MLHTTKFQDNWPSSSGEEDWFKLLPYMEMADILVM